MPRHPFMARNGRSNLHDDAYQSDSYHKAGPLGYHPAVTSTFFAQECASLTRDQKGRLVTVCVGLSNVTLRMLDPVSLATLASYSLGTRHQSTSPFTSFGGGGYFYLDNRDRVVVPTSNGRIDVIAEAGTKSAPRFVLRHQYDVSAAVGNSVILSVLPDWSGRYWFVTSSGAVGTVARRSGAVRHVQLPHHETIGNSFAVDETGAVYIVTDHALYRFRAGRHGRPVVSWRRRYDAGTRTKPGQSEFGSGTTPTIIRRHGRHFVAITDNADPRMHVLVYRTGAHAHQRICKKAVFATGHSDTDNSLIAFGNSIVVENNYGYTGPVEKPPAGADRGTPTTSPGVTRIAVNYRRGGCHRVWTNHQVRVPTSVSKASTGAGLIYVYEHPAASQVRYTAGKQPSTGPEDPWYLTALDIRTGHRVWSVMTGDGLGYNNNYAPVTLGRRGTAYIGVLGGLVEVRDQRH